MKARVLSLCVSLAVLTPLAATAAPKNNPPPSGNTRREKTQTELFKFVSAAEIMFSGHKHIAVSALSLTSGRPMRLMVPNVNQNSNEPNADVAASVNTLKPGDVFKAEIWQEYGAPAIRKLDPVETKPGEDNPHGYVFVESAADATPPVVRLTKYGQDVELTIPRVKGEKGQMEPDPAVQEQLQKFKKGEVVYVLLQGRSPVLQAIYPYKEPQSGKLTKIADQEVDGQKVPAVEIEGDDGKTVTALVPGKTVNKKWVPDANVMRLVHAVRPKTQVQFTTADQGDKTYLLDIQKAAAVPASEKMRAGK